MSHVDILEQHDSLKKPLIGSFVFHAAVAGSLILMYVVKLGSHTQFGTPNPSGGAVGINVVRQIPLPGRAITNPLANDTQSLVPKPPPEPKAKPQKKAPPPEPDAVAIGKKKILPKPNQKIIFPDQIRLPQERKQNQVYSSTGQAASTPIYGIQGAGGVGIGENSPFGTQFGWYAALIQQRIQTAWQTATVNGTSATPATISFVIQRDGSIPQDSVRIVQRSGNPALDFSAQRAVLDAGKMPPLPNGFNKSEARVEFQFLLRR